jgi:hypothetical protein
MCLARLLRQICVRWFCKNGEEEERYGEFGQAVQELRTDRDGSGQTQLFETGVGLSVLNWEP